MSQHSIIEIIAAKLREDHKELSVYESLDIACKIQNCELAERALINNKRRTPVGLEAVGGILAHTPENTRY